MLPLLSSSSSSSSLSSWSWSKRPEGSRHWSRASSWEWPSCRSQPQPSTNYDDDDHVDNLMMILVGYYWCRMWWYYVKSNLHSWRWIWSARRAKQHLIMMIMVMMTLTLVTIRIVIIVIIIMAIIIINTWCLVSPHWLEATQMKEPKSLVWTRLTWNRDHHDDDAVGNNVSQWWKYVRERGSWEWV